MLLKLLSHKGKVKSYKKQIEEAEEIAALNLARLPELGDASASVEQARGGEDLSIQYKWTCN